MDFHLSKSLLDDGYEVLGIDNVNDYYNPQLKLDRLSLLKKYKNFNFEKIDISDRISLTKSFKSFGPKKVVNLAAQAGVRYSIENPYAYMSSNLIGFLNIIELCRHSKVEGLIYASSSSVYGANKKIPFKVTDRVDKPLALYGATKKNQRVNCTFIFLSVWLAYYWLTLFYGVWTVGSSRYGNVYFYKKNISI